jgi:hypothetical protein
MPLITDEMVADSINSMLLIKVNDKWNCLMELKSWISNWSPPTPNEMSSTKYRYGMANTQYEFK